MNEFGLNTLTASILLVMLLLMIFISGRTPYLYDKTSSLLKKNHIKENWYNPFHFYFALRKMNQNTADFNLKQESDKLLLSFHRLLMLFFLLMLLINIFVELM